jgi:hypothetical protein
MKHAVYITYQELFDRHPTQEELNQLISGLDALKTTMVAARLNTMVRRSVSQEDPNGGLNFQSWFVKEFFDDETRKRLMDRFGNENPNRRPVCHPIQLLSIMRITLAMAAGGGESQAEFTERDRHKFGTACLMVNDLFCTLEEREHIQTGPQDERMKHLLLQVLAPGEASNPTPFRNLLFRSYYVYRIALQDPEIIYKIRKECEGLDFERNFEDVVGTPLQGWLSLVIGLYTHLFNHSLEEFVGNPSVFVVDRKTILEKPALTTAQVNSFFDRLSSSFEDLREELKRLRRVDERFDLVPFMAKPFLEFAPGRCFCVDLALLSEKLNNGPYFLLSSLLPERKREPVFKAWGILFEAYVNWLLRGLEGRHGATFYPDTRWDDESNKSFDAVFVKARLVVTMEFKGGFLKQEARYSNDVNAFTADLDTKIGVGCKQLARDTAQLFPEKGKRKRLHGVPIPSNTEWVLPVLVVQDLILRTPFINYFLNQRFQAERKRFPTESKVEVLPLNVIQVSTLESLVEMSETFNLDVISVLHRRCRSDVQMRQELQSFISELPEAKRRRCSARFQQVFEKSREEMCAMLFKDWSKEPT